MTALLSPVGSQAFETKTDYNGMSIVGVGTGTDGTAFFDLSEFSAQEPAKGCIYGLYYVKLDTPGGRSIFASLLYAKSMGKKLLRLDWDHASLPTGNFCLVSLIILKD